jgi:tRNA(Ile)-lysidine synthase
VDTEFSWQRLAKVLQRFPSARRYWVAFSGGLDSHALLHAATVLRDQPALPEVWAAHINHGLHPEADDWERHCANVCQALNVPFWARRVRAQPRTGESPEAAARQARYRALLPLIAEGDLLLIAHHLDDQAETLLFQLMRGAGPSGLAAMPACAPFGKGWLGRPLLEVSRATLERYGYAQRLRWITDSSNIDTRYDRNFIRHQVLPTLQARWPSVNRTLSRVVANQQDVVHLLEDVAAGDCAAIAGSVPRTLSRRRLLALAPERQRNVVRNWLRSLALPMAARTHLEAILLDAAFGREETSPCIRWPGAEVRRYRDDIYAMRPRLVAPKLQRSPPWDFKAPLELAYGQLSATTVRGAGLSASQAELGPVEVRFRDGGERCRPAGRRCTRMLKKLFQEQGVPPWDRGWLPLIYIDGELAAVADLWVCEPFAAREGEHGWLLSWQFSVS